MTTNQADSLTDRQLVAALARMLDEAKDVLWHLQHDKHHDLYQATRPYMKEGQPE
jgi:hypothetical protein